MLFDICEASEELDMADTFRIGGARWESLRDVLRPLTAGVVKPS